MRSEGRSEVFKMLRRRRTSAPVIRPLHSHWAEGCARIHSEGFAHPWTPEEIANLIDAGAIGAVALDPLTGALNGFAMSRIAADEAEILTIAVAIGSRARGVGRALLTDIFFRTTNAGARAIFLEVSQTNVAALALYRRLGFVKVGERTGYYGKPTGAEATAAVMRRALP